MKKYTFEEAVKLLKYFPNEISEYVEGWMSHEELGKSKVLQKDIVGYYEGNVDWFTVVQFENCEEPIGVSYTTNSWDEGDRSDGIKFARVESKSAERWFKKDGRKT